MSLHATHPVDQECRPRFEAIDNLSGKSSGEDSSLRTRDTDGLVHAVQRSLLRVGVDALLGYTNPYEYRTTRTIELASFFVKTRLSKDRVMMFCSRHSQEENKIILKNLKVFLRACLKLPGCGRVTLIKDCETYNQCGPFEIVQNDSRVRVLTEQLLIEDTGSDVIIKFEIAGNRRCIFSSKLSGWLGTVNGTRFDIGDDLGLSLPAMATTQSDMETATVLGIVNDSSTPQTALQKPKKGKPKEVTANNEDKASFEQFQLCPIQQASSLISTRFLKEWMCPIWSWKRCTTLWQRIGSKEYITTSFR